MDHRDIILGISGTSCSRFSKIVVRTLKKFAQKDQKMLFETKFTRKFSQKLVQKNK